MAANEREITLEVDSSDTAKTSPQVADPKLGLGEEVFNDQLENDYRNRLNEQKIPGRIHDVEPPKGNNIISQFRKDYPQYDDMADHELAQGLYNYYYSDMHPVDFEQKSGMSLSQALTPEEFAKQWLPYQSGKENLKPEELDEATKLQNQYLNMTPQEQDEVKKHLEQMKKERVSTKGMFLSEDEQGKVTLNAWENIKKFMASGDEGAAFRIVSGLASGAPATATKGALGAFGGKVGRSPIHEFDAEDIKNIKWLKEDLRLGTKEIAKQMTNYIYGKNPDKEITANHINEVLRKEGLISPRKAPRDSPIQEAVKKVDTKGKSTGEILNDPAIENLIHQFYETGTSPQGIATNLRQGTGNKDITTQMIHNKINDLLRRST